MCIQFLFGCHFVPSSLHLYPPAQEKMHWLTQLFCSSLGLMMLRAVTLATLVNALFAMFPHSQILLIVQNSQQLDHNLGL